MSTKTNRLASYKKENKQIIVSTVAELRTKWSGMTLGQIAQELGITSDDDVKFEYYENFAGNLLPNITLTKGDQKWAFNVSGPLATLWEDGEFNGNILDCEGREYEFARPVTEDMKDENGAFIMENGRRKQAPKLDKDKNPVTEQVPSFNIGKPSGYRNYTESHSVYEGEMTAEDAAALLAGGGGN